MACASDKSKTTHYKPRTGGFNKNLELYKKKHLDLIKIKCQKYLKYFDYAYDTSSSEAKRDPYSIFEIDGSSNDYSESHEVEQG